MDPVSDEGLLQARRDQLLRELSEARARQATPQDEEARRLTEERDTLERDLQVLRDEGARLAREIKQLEAAVATAELPRAKAWHRGRRP